MDVSLPCPVCIIRILQDTPYCWPSSSQNSPRPLQDATGASCPQCRGNALKLYDHYTRKAAFINDEGARRTFIIKDKRFRCRQCRYLFREPIEGLLPKKRSSEQHRQAMAQEYLKHVSNKTIAREFSVSESTVEHIIHEQFQRTIKQALNYPAPLMIGIDEHIIYQGATFATTIADLSNHRIYDVIEGKSRAMVEKTLISYEHRGKSDDGVHGFKLQLEASC